jgi:hypothetical protein
MVVYIPLINCEPAGFRTSIQGTASEQTHIGSTPVSNSTFGAIDPLGFRDKKWRLWDLSRASGS